MADFNLNVKNFDAVTETVGSEMNHTIVVDGDNFRIRYDEEFQFEETQITVAGIKINLGLRLIYILEDICSKKANGTYAKWFRKFTPAGSPDEIPFSAIKANRSDFVEEVFPNSDIKTVVGNNKIVNDTISRYVAINKRIDSVFRSKDVFDITQDPPTYEHPTLFQYKKTDETAADADDGAVKVWPLGAGDPSSYEVQLDITDGAGGWNVHQAWTTLSGDFVEFTGLADDLYRIRVRDNANTVSKLEQITINAGP